MAPPSGRVVATVAVCAVAGLAIVYLSSRGQKKDRKKDADESNKDTAATAAYDEPLIAEPPRVDRSLVIPETDTAVSKKEQNASKDRRSQKERSRDVVPSVTDTSVPELKNRRSQKDRSLNVVPAATETGREIKKETDLLLVTEKSQDEKNEPVDSAPTQEAKKADNKSQQGTPSKKRRPKKKKQAASPAKQSSTPTAEMVQEEKKEQIDVVQKEPATKTADASKTNGADANNAENKKTQSPSKRRRPKKKKVTDPSKVNITASSTPNPDVAAVLKAKTTKKKKAAPQGAAAHAAKEIKSFNQQTGSAKKKKPKAKR